MDRLVVFKINSPTESFALQRVLLDEGIQWGTGEPSTQKFPHYPYLVVWPSLGTGQLFFSVANECDVKRYKNAALFDAGDYLIHNFNVRPSFMNRLEVLRWDITESRLFNSIMHPDMYDVMNLVKRGSLEMLAFLVFFTFLHIVGGFEISIRMFLLLGIGWIIGTSIRPVFRFARNKLLDRG